jgi:hypothetical protein
MAPRVTLAALAMSHSVAEATPRATKTCSAASNMRLRVSPAAAFVRFIAS